MLVLEFRVRARVRVKVRARARDSWGAKRPGIWKGYGTKNCQIILVLSFEVVGVIWLSFKPVLAHANCVSSTLLASMKSVKCLEVFKSTRCRLRENERSLFVDRRMDVDRVRYMAARAPWISDAVADLHRQPDAANRRHWPGARRAGGARPHLRRHELSRLLWHVRRQRLFSRLREYSVV